MYEGGNVTQEEVCEILISYGTLYVGGVKSFRSNNEKTNVSFQNYFYFST